MLAHRNSALFSGEFEIELREPVQLRSPTKNHNSGAAVGLENQAIHLFFDAFEITPWKRLRSPEIVTLRSWCRSIELLTAIPEQALVVTTRQCRRET